MAEGSNLTFDIEVLQKENSLIEKKALISQVGRWMSSQSNSEEERLITNFDNELLSENVSNIRVYTSGQRKNGLCPEVLYHVYSINSSSPIYEETEDDQQISTQWILPTLEFCDLWDSLIFDSHIKEELLNYVSTALEFSDRCVNPQIIAYNRVVLLHGPPGTGKTSLCKALAQKVCIRYSNKFLYGQLIEVNTHSLFSKWFSESGKLVGKMFQSILSLVENPQVLVIVLLDEVESLARSRTSCMGGNEPSDALRVVNALLTHLDMIKRYPNVLILTTSNITDAIDVALIDRADIRQFIGLPSVEAIYQIYCSCIKELHKTGILSTQDIFMALNKLTNLLLSCGDNSEAQAQVLCAESSVKLKSIAEKSVGLSGRALRKMPFIACSLLVKTKVITQDVFLDALSKTVEKQWEDVEKLKIHN